MVTHENVVFFNPSFDGKYFHVFFWTANPPTFRLKWYVQFWNDLVMRRLKISFSAGVIQVHKETQGSNTKYVLLSGNVDIKKHLHKHSWKELEAQRKTQVKIIPSAGKNYQKITAMLLKILIWTKMLSLAFEDLRKSHRTLWFWPSRKHNTQQIRHQEYW